MPLQRLLEMVRRAGGSISIRITAYFTLVACILLLVAVMFLQWALSRNLFGEDRQFLHDKVHVIRDILAVHPLDWDSLHEEFQWEGRTFRYTHYYARLLDAKGTIRIETARMRQVIPMNVFPLPKESGSAGEKGTRWQENGRTFLLMSAWAQPHKPALGEIQLALDVTREDHMIAAYRQELALVLLAGILLAAGMGAFAARRALKPLEAITRNARQVSFETLGTRLGATRWPRELESLARAFDEMLERLEQSYTRLSQFSADIAHELRTPIHNMMGEAEVTLLKNRSIEEYRQAIESSLDNYARLARMIDSLLFLARVDHDHYELHRSWFEVREEASRLCDFFSVMADELGIDIEVSGHARIWADMQLVSRALSNVLDNALRHTKAPGKIRIRIQPFPGQRKGVRIAVEDTGCGISPEQQDKVFDRFYRVDVSRTASSSGCGLGLAIVRSIMVMHGGAVGLDSIPGQGTTVWMDFPEPEMTDLS